MLYSKKKNAGPRDPRNPDSKNDGSGENRRRLGRVVHDDRGNAVVHWDEAPPDYERPVLEVEASDIRRALHRRLDSEQWLPGSGSFDPYARFGPLEHKRPQGPGSRTDLRKLSEWIKMMRELEERKQRGDRDDD